MSLVEVHVSATLDALALQFRDLLHSDIAEQVRCGTTFVPRIIVPTRAWQRQVRTTVAASSSDPTRELESSVLYRMFKGALLLHSILTINGHNIRQFDAHSDIRWFDKTAFYLVPIPLTLFSDAAMVQDLDSVLKAIHTTTAGDAQ